MSTITVSLPRLSADQYTALRTQAPHCGELTPVVEFLLDFGSDIQTEGRSGQIGDIASKHYATVYRIATDATTFPDGGKWCWREYQHLISDYIRGQALPRLAAAQKNSPEAFIAQYVTSWSTFQSFLSLTKFVFSYLDEWYLDATPYSLTNRANEIWAYELFDPLEYCMQDQRPNFRNLYYGEKSIQARTQGASSSGHVVAIQKQQQELEKTANPYRYMRGLYHVNWTPELQYPELARTSDQSRINQASLVLKNWPTAQAYGDGTHQILQPNDQVSELPNSEALVLPKTIREIAIDSFLAVASRERQGHIASYDNLAKFTQSLTELGRFSFFDKAIARSHKIQPESQQKFIFAHYMHLQEGFCKQLQQYYTQELNVAEMDFREYTAQLRSIFVAERTRVDSYMNIISASPVAILLHKILLADTLGQLLSKPGSMEYFTAEGNLKDTESLFDMASNHNDTVKVFADAFQTYVSTISRAIIADFSASDKKYKEFREAMKDKTKAPAPGTTPPPRPNPLVLIQTLIERDTHFRRILSQCCRENVVVGEALRAASENAISSEEKVIAHTLAEYASQSLSNRSRQSASSSQSLEGVTSLFRYIRSKDMFEQEYQRLLCSRILSGESLGLVHEQNALKALMKEAGQSFAQNMKLLEADIQTSQVFSAKFSADRAELLAGQGLEVSFNICTYGHAWSTFRSQYSVRYSLRHGLVTNKRLPQDGETAESIAQYDHTRLPEAMQLVWQQFGQFYCTSHENRYLDFFLDEGICEVTFIPEPSKSLLSKTLVVTPIMAVILMTLGKSTKFILFSDLVDQTGINARLLGAHLLPLLQPLDKAIVKKAPPTLSFSGADKLLLNKAYENNSAKIVVPFKRQLTTTEQKAQDNDLLASRKFTAKAAIVRYMKMVKSCTHNNLLMQVTEQLAPRFPATPAFLKECFDAVIHDDYMERDENDHNTYVYKA